jgi:GGDEF domain-containing protein
VSAALVAAACVLGVAGTALADRRTAETGRELALARITEVAAALAAPDGDPGARVDAQVARLGSRPDVRSVVLVSSDGVVEAAAAPARYPAGDSYGVGDVVPAPVLEDVLAAVHARVPGVRGTPADATAPSGLLTLAVPLRRDGRAAVLHVVLDGPRPASRALPLDGGLPAGPVLGGALVALLAGAAVLTHAARSRGRDAALSRELRPRDELDGDLAAAVALARAGADPLTLVLLQAPGVDRTGGSLSRRTAPRRLALVASVLTRELPGPAYRIGAGAFVVLLRGVEPDTATHRVERTALVLERALGQTPVRAGISCLDDGDAGSPLAGADGDRLLVRADAALHEARALGTGRVVLAPRAGRPLVGDGRATSRAA